MGSIGDATGPRCRKRYRSKDIRSTVKDVIKFRVNITSNERPETKRKIVWKTARIFDPLGFLALVINIKMLMK